MRISLIIILFTTFMSCGKKVNIPGLDVEKWRESPVCSEYRIQGGIALEQNEDQLLSLTQLDLEGILGVAPRHELGKRSEKFFYYPLSENCDSLPNKSLQLRFDALGRAKEILIVLTD